MLLRAGQSVLYVGRGVAADPVVALVSVAPSVPAAVAVGGLVVVGLVSTAEAGNELWQG